MQVVNELGPEITTLCQHLRTSELGGETPALPPGAEVGTPIFELYLSVQEFSKSGSYNSYCISKLNLLLSIVGLIKLYRI